MPDGTSNSKPVKLDPGASWDMRIYRSAPPPGQCDRLGMLFRFPEPVGLPAAVDALWLWELRNSDVSKKLPPVYIHGVVRKSVGGFGMPADGTEDVRTMRTSGADPWKGVKSSAWLFSWSDIHYVRGGSDYRQTVLHDWLNALRQSLRQCLSDTEGNGRALDDGAFPRPSALAAARLGLTPMRGQGFPGLAPKGDEVSLSIATAHRAAQKKVAWVYDKTVKPHLDAVQELCACPGIAVELPLPDEPQY